MMFMNILICIRSEGLNTSTDWELEFDKNQKEVDLFPEDKILF